EGRRARGRLRAPEPPDDRAARRVGRARAHREPGQPRAPRSSAHGPGLADAPAPPSHVVTAPLPQLLYEDAVRRALAEDLGRAGDLTTDAIVPASAVAAGRLVARKGLRVAGLDVASLAFRLLDPEVAVKVARGDGCDAK